MHHAMAIHKMSDRASWRVVVFAQMFEQLECIAKLGVQGFGGVLHNG